MHQFTYRDGQLHCEGTPLADLAQAHGTPLYVYSAATLRDHYHRLDAAFAAVPHSIQYAVKANSNLAVLDLLRREGAGFDIVSGGELQRVLKVGGDPAKISFAGVGKTEAEIRAALRARIHAFVSESWAELVEIDRIAAELGVSAPVAVRVNPNVDAQTHKYISTGKSENKFGIDFDRIESIYARAAAELPQLHLRGLQMHIGSQLTTVQPFVEAVSKVAPLARTLRAAHGIEFFSIGGGLGIVYATTLESGRSSWWDELPEDQRPLTIEAYAAALVPLLAELGLTIHLEPGRLIAGNAGVLMTRLLYTKRGKAKTFQICDAGMGDLIRPALYQSHHDIVPVVEPDPRVGRERVDIVGPICESGDFLAQDADLPPLRQGDLVALMSAGAYGFTMASNYNSRPLPAEVLVEGLQSRVIRKRQDVEDLWAGESV